MATASSSVILEKVTPLNNHVLEDRNGEMARTEMHRQWHLDRVQHYV